MGAAPWTWPPGASCLLTSPVTALLGAFPPRSPALGRAPSVCCVRRRPGRPVLKRRGSGLTVCPACLLRIFIIWVISSWFRRGPAPQDQAGPGGAPRVASRNLFPKDTLMVTAGWEARLGRRPCGGGCEGVTWAVGTDRSLVAVSWARGPGLRTPGPSSAHETCVTLVTPLRNSF